MRVVCVGGAGAMGRAAVRTMATFDEVSELLVLDRDIVRADALSCAVGSKVKAIAFDAEVDDLAAYLTDEDAVLSTLGPFTVFGHRVLAAAVDAGCDYVDINDDWEPTLQVLKLDEAARAVGITALVGMGASPGVTNVLAVRAAAELDEVYELITGWAVAGTESEPGGSKPSAAMLHLVHQCTGKVRVVEDGAPAMVPPLRSLTLQYPGLGSVEVRTVGHPEAVTLPRLFAGLRRCVNVMSGPGWWFERLEGLMAQADGGEISAREAAMRLEEPRERPAGAPRTVRTPSLWAWARGVRHGRPTTVAAGLNRWAPGKMAGATAVPAALALQMLLRGEIARPGVVTPEEVVPFDLLMERLAPSCTLPEGSEMPLVAVVTDVGDGDG